MRHWDLEFRYYDMPRKCPALCLYGERWKMLYGGDNCLHFHNVLELGICREGSGTMVFPQEEKPYRAGDISIIPKYISHSTESAYSWWEYVFLDADVLLDRLMISENTRQTLKNRIECRALLLNVQTHPQLWQAIEAILKEDAAGAHYGSEIMECRGKEIVYLIARENRDYARYITELSQRQDRKIKEALDYIELHYAQPLSVGQIAQAASMSETNFRRTFRRIMNMPPNDYLNMVRIRHACSLLSDTDRSVELISEACGFTTPSTFNRNFRHFLGTTPLKWRKDVLNSGRAMPGIRVSAYHGWGQDHEDIRG